MKMLLKFRLLSLIITCGILLSCNKQQNKSSSQENYEKIDYYSDSINTVRIDNISLNTINILIGSHKTHFYALSFLIMTLWIEIMKIKALWH